MDKQGQTATDKDEVNRGTARKAEGQTERKIKESQVKREKR